MKIAVALLLDVPDDAEVSSSIDKWNVILRSFGSYGISVERVEVHSDPDVIFGADSEVWLIQEKNPSGLLSDRGYWHNDVEGFTGWGDVRTATRFSDHNRATLSLPFDGVWVVDAPK